MGDAFEAAGDSSRPQKQLSRPRAAEFRVEVMGIEPTTSSMRPKRSSQLSYTPGKK